MPVEAISGGIGAVGPEWDIAVPQDGAVTAPADGGSGFGSMLADQLGALQATQDDAAAQSQALAAGTAEDVSSVVMAVERAQLSMQLASQLRNRGVEAFQELFRTQV